MAEQPRQASRQRVLKAGSITMRGGGAINCVVRNLSATEAALDVASPVGIPDRFVLVIGADQSKHRCRVVWRSEKRIGATF
jgi:hypothetical protein